MTFPSNIPSDDAAIFDEQSLHPALSHFSSDDSSDSSDTEDPMTRGQTLSDRVDMFRMNLPPIRPRRVRGGNASPIPVLTKMTPGARRIP